MKWNKYQSRSKVKNPSGSGSIGGGVWHNLANNDLKKNNSIKLENEKNKRERKREREMIQFS